MWAIFKKWFKTSEIEPLQNESSNDIASEIISKPSMVQEKENTQFNDHDNYVYGFSSKKLSDFDLLILNLRSYSGYIRESTLNQNRDNYNVELFPYVLERLSDYVDVNCKLAAAHIIRWSQKANFSQLCIDHFLGIAALKYRNRTDQNIFNLLLSEVGHQQIYLSETLTSKQGKLPRVLLNFIIEYQWMDESELFKLCQMAKDQKIRAYWLENMIQNETDDSLYRALKHSAVKDVQYQLFDVLYRKNILSTDDLVHFWHNRFPNIMDYAYFALRQKAFDFEKYFSQNPIEHLPHIEVKIRAQQWLFMKGEVRDFFKILAQLHSKELAYSFVLKALKKQYIDLDIYFDFLTESKQTVKFYHLSKLKKCAQRHLNLDELTQYLTFVDEPITLQQRLHMVDGYNGWDQLYWFVINRHHIQNDHDKHIFDDYIVPVIGHLSYEIYGVQWNADQKEQMRSLLPAFVQQYSKLFEHKNVQNTLKLYLEP